MTSDPGRADFRTVREAADDIAVFLDLDGTLLEIAPTPDAVHVGLETLALLERSRLALGGALALITGRAIDDVDALLAPLALPIAGQHGFERRDADGRRHAYARRPPRLDAARDALTAFADRHPGVLIEDKGCTLAAHYRLVPDAGASLRLAVEREVAAAGGTLALHHSKMAFEVRPAGRDKGVAIAEFLAEPPFAGRRPVFIGDDATDEHGFAVVNDRGGRSVKVGAGATVAHWRLPDVGAVREWLARLAHVPHRAAAS
jgi:trehalose 6-phosphate phosphatase